ncbi:inverse autotransporter beta domain-containing protein [Providencia rettgeri]|uniref:Inverse autotransporter beta domain-containing protein n=1 Tax=Providencia rettgeri TaxID=587 RepID=A0A939NBX7_PRORE|nr:inverse autotransporter beta domain-containing protein [Providencia rettgeri]
MKVGYPYANLGANLKLEQYYGDDVALFGKNERQKDQWRLPSASIGLHFPARNNCRT